MTTTAAEEQVRQLVSFRDGFYEALTRWGDALFELSDAVLCAPGALSSVPSLSLEPEFTRGHGSLYKSLARGGIDCEALRELLVTHRPAGRPQIFAVDASVWDRCDAECSPERGFYHSASKHSAGQPIVAGWSYQWVSQLSFDANSWSAPLDVERIPAGADATVFTIDQVRRLAGLLGDEGSVPIFVFDAGYDPIAIGHGLAATRAEVLVRLRSDRVFYTDPPARDGGRGRPSRHGHRFKLSDDASAPAPDGELTRSDPRYGNVRVRAWHGLHPKLSGRGRWGSAGSPPIVRGTVIRVDVDHLPKATSRTDTTLWLWWSGPGEPDLEQCFRAYLHRFDLEHTFRFAKNTLGWTAPSLCTPQQADRWTWLIVGATPSYASPAGSSTTTACRGNDRASRPSSPRLVSAEVLDEFVRWSELRPVHRNPGCPDLAARKAPDDLHGPAIRWSRRLRKDVA
jgi:hypothetical protein